MHIFWEKKDWPGARVEPAVTCLSWLPLDGAEGLLGAGSQSGSVGITRTDIRPHSASASPNKRLNFNLRGHHTSIALVAWNPTQNKLATCDDSGIIYVWVPYEERWSVELVNDRGIKVRDFAWSPNGSAALICYEDNFVLIGSANGQRIWSNNFPDTSVQCGCWNPGSNQVVLGTAAGKLHVLSDQGAAIGEFLVRSDVAIEKLSWSSPPNLGESRISACFSDGSIYLLESTDDADPVVIGTSLSAVTVVQWTSTGEFLGVMGQRTDMDQLKNRLQVYGRDGTPVYSSEIPLSNTAGTAFTWAHEDQCVVIVAGGELAVGRVLTQVPALQLLSSYRVWTLLQHSQESITCLPLPAREKNMIDTHNYHVIQCQIPTPADLCAAVCCPTPWRWFCTIKPIPKQPQTYALCLEHMGGLVPILRGKQINKLLPEFEIRLQRHWPYISEAEGGGGGSSRSRSGTPEEAGDIGNDDLEPEELQRGKFQRDSMWRRSKRHLQAMVQRAQQHAQGAVQKKEEKLIQVTSNVWCTRFKVLGMANRVLPPYLGQVMYKTSVLHLQPRQMTVHVVDLEQKSAVSAPVPPPSSDVDNFFESGVDENLLGQPDDGPPVAPMEREIFVGGATAAGRETSQDLLAEEQALLHQVLEEFSDLRSAVDQHIQRMREFASDLQRSSQTLQQRRSSASHGPLRQTGSLSTELKSSSGRDLEWSVDVGATSSAVGGRDEAPKEVEEEDDEEKLDRWAQELDQMEFMDEDESLLVTSELEKQRLRARTLSCGVMERQPRVTDSPPFPPPGHRTKHRARRPPHRSGSEQSGSPGLKTYACFSRPSNGSCKQLTEITSVLDKLYKLANELTTRPGVADINGGGASVPVGSPGLLPPHPQSGGKVSPNRNLIPPALLMDGDPGPYSQLRVRIREIAQRVSELERRINYGNELLDEVRGDLRKRVQHIRQVLGDRPLPASDGEESVGKKEERKGRRVRGRHLSDNAGGAIGEEAKKPNERVIVLQNKAPFWNEQSQVYQLDFGGRVTQESAKNFQIERDEQQVMQFGRIENGAYTLDFQSPFSAVQAFAVALASITQRLK